MAADEQAGTPDEQPSPEFAMVPIRRRRLFARPFDADVADHDEVPSGDEVDDDQDRQVAGDPTDPDDPAAADPDARADITDIAEPAYAAAPAKQSSTGWRAAVSALEHAPDGSLYLPTTTPSYLRMRDQPGASDENVFGAPDDDDGEEGADYRPARVVRSSPGWEFSKWLVAAAVAAVFVLGSFLVIPAIFEPKSADVGPTASAAPTAAPQTTAARAPYSDVIMQSAPTHYWRFSGAALGNDELGTAPLSIGEDVTYLGASPVYGGMGAVDCAGTSRSQIYSSTAEAAPPDFTVELWFSAATKEGGQLLGFNTKDSGFGGIDADREEDLAVRDGDFG